MNSFEVFGWFPVIGDYNLTSPGEPTHIAAVEVSPALLAATGAAPIAGRFFNESDGANVAVISKRLLQRFGSDFVGRSITLNGETYTVVGAMPGWFRFPLVTVENQDSRNDVWLPLKKPRSESELRDYSIYSGYGKLRPGVPLAQAKAEARRVAEETWRQNHPSDPTYTSALFTLKDMVAQKIRPVLFLLLGASAFLLLITCANVAGLLVSRAVGRARETAVRIALGARRNQLALQYFFEILWLSLAAAVAGLLLSVAFVRVMVALAADYIPRADEITTNWKVALFAMGLAVLTAGLAALAPLWQAFRTQPNEVLSDGVRSSAGMRSRKLSQALVIAEVALAFSLLSTAAVLIWQFRSLKSTSPGFEPNGLLTFQLVRSAAQAKNSEQSSAYIGRVLDAIEAIPGVTDAAVANQIPLAGCCFSSTLFPEPTPITGDQHQTNSLNVVSATYFKTMRIPLRRAVFSLSTIRMKSSRPLSLMKRQPSRTGPTVRRWAEPLTWRSGWNPGSGCRNCRCGEEQSAG